MSHLQYAVARLRVFATRYTQLPVISIGRVIILSRILILLVLLLSIAHSQTDSIREILQYYPLQTGNYWEYGTTLVSDFGNAEGYSYTIRITGDTILSNGSTYKILFYNYLFPYMNSDTSFERVDSITGCVYRFTSDSDTISINHERIVDSLFAQPGDVFDVSRYWFEVVDNFKPYFEFLDQDTILGVVTMTRHLRDTSFNRAIFVFAKGIGFCMSELCIAGCSYTNLLYARIGGIEYGTSYFDRVTKNNSTPGNYSLSQNYPNPFNSSTDIQFSVPDATSVHLIIYNPLGQEVAQLLSQRMNAGTYTIKWDASGFASGVYYYRLEAGSFIETKKLLLLR